MAQPVIGVGDLDARTRRRTLRRPRWLGPLAFVAVSLIIIAGVDLYPFVSGVYLSMTNSSLLATGPFAGLAAFATVLTSPEFGSALQFSLLFAACAVCGSYVVGLLLALLLNGEVWGRGLFRALLLLPWIVPPIVTIVCWRWMLDESGLINLVLGHLGISPIYFLASIFWARVAVIVVKIWASFPFMMITCLAGLQTIPQELYEAASIDGCGSFAAFRHITLPHLRMISAISCLLLTIWSVNDFTTIWLLTQGGPVDATLNLINLAFRYAFQVGNVGLGSAVSVITMVLMLGMGVAVLRTLAAQKEEV